MPEDKFADINELWEEVQLLGLTCAKEVLSNDPAGIATEQQIALAVAVIRTFGPTPLGLDEILQGVAGALAPNDEADAVKSDPIV